MTEERLRTIDAVTKIVAAFPAAIIPVVVVVAGGWIQTAVQRQTVALQTAAQQQAVDRDYVQIAISILTKKRVALELKQCATHVLARRPPSRRRQQRI